MASLMRIIGSSIGPALAAMYMQSYQYVVNIGTTQHSFPTAAGQALPHHIYPESGWVSYWIRNSGDIPVVINLFKLQYERLKSRSPFQFTG